ncbi:MAG: hypothetical protein KDE03_06935 [Rhodobacteraceae bacterium]|nr:hypothetical protein [Paracoccaceae bacterium]
MKLIKICIFASLLPAILSGCASQIMSGYVGRDVTDVVVKYGPPVNAFDLPDGRRAFQWRIDSSYAVPGVTNYSGYTYGGYTTGTATTSGGFFGSQTCFYTLYAKSTDQKRWTITGFEPPRLDCE